MGVCAKVLFWKAAATVTPPTPGTENPPQGGDQHPPPGAHAVQSTRRGEGRTCHAPGLEWGAARGRVAPWGQQGLVLAKWETQVQDLCRRGTLGWGSIGFRLTWEEREQCSHLRNYEANQVFCAQSKPKDHEVVPNVEHSAASEAQCRARSSRPWTPSPRLSGLESTPT